MSDAASTQVLELPLEPSAVKPPLNVWVISDGIAGHFNQSKGVLLALAERYTLSVSWMELHLRSGLFRVLLRAWMNLSKGRLPLALLETSYQRAAPWPTIAPDVVVGAGGKVMYAVGALAHSMRAQSVFVGSLRHLRPDVFDAVLVLESHGEPEYMTLDLAPTAIDPIACKSAADAWRARHPQVQKPLWTMLVGGDGAGANYTAADWKNLAMSMNQVAEQRGIQWLITTSRRTGAEAEALLKATLNPASLAETVWWNESPKAIMTPWLGLAEVVCCTADSLSMLTEAVSAQRPVIALTPLDFKPEPRFKQALERLKARQWLAVHSLIELPTAKPHRLEPLSEPVAIALGQRLAEQLQRFSLCQGLK